MFLIVPYSTDLRVYHKPYVTYAVALLCVFIFFLQVTSPDSFTQKLMYYPDTLNPITMITSSLAHGDFMHILFNLIFFLAFSPAVEVVINNKRKFVFILVVISVIASLSYALSILLSGGEAIPTLGLSGVVTGTIGLSAYLLPKARIKVFIWFFTIVKTIFIPAWMVAIWYIGGDTWDLLASVDRGNTNVIAHVAGGFAGYFIGYFYLKEERDDAKEELEDEMEYARAKRTAGTFQSSYKGGHLVEKKLAQRQAKTDYSNYESELCQCVRTDRDSEAMMLILKDYDIQKDSIEIYEELFETMKQWGNSRALFCLARLLIDRLIEQKKQAKALMVIEQCLNMTDRFILANSNHVLYMYEMAKLNHQYPLAYAIIRDANNRYYNQIDNMRCALMEIDILSQYLNLPMKAQWKVDEFLVTAEGEFKEELVKLKAIL
jgi:membrane associated rhomboid family serine protease